MKNMKSIVALSFVLSPLFIACGNESAGTSSQSKDSSTQPMALPPPSNSDATNSSLADTAYHVKDSLQTKKDSSRKK